MPKNKLVTKRDGILIKTSVPSKLRIGSRKSGRSAHVMSNAALQTIKPKSKDYQNAQTVLKLRGIK